MEGLLKDFEVEPKNPSSEALRRWRKLVTVFKNHRRRFRNTANLEKRLEVEQQKLKIKVFRLTLLSFLVMISVNTKFFVPFIFTGLENVISSFLMDNNASGFYADTDGIDSVSIFFS